MLKLRRLAYDEPTRGPLVSSDSTSDLYRYTTEACEKAEALAKIKHIDFDVKISLNIPPITDWKITWRFSHILETLLVAAVEHTFDGGVKIIVDFGPGKEKEQQNPKLNYLNVTITDTGVAMTTFQQKSLFNEGAMQMAMNEVKEMGGTLHVDSVPNVGTTFELSFCIGTITEDFEAWKIPSSVLVATRDTGELEHINKLLKNLWGITHVVCVTDGAAALQELYTNSLFSTQAENNGDYYTTSSESAMHIDNTHSNNTNNQNTTTSTTTTSNNNNNSSSTASTHSTNNNQITTSTHNNNDPLGVGNLHYSIPKFQLIILGENLEHFSTGVVIHNIVQNECFRNARIITCGFKHPLAQSVNGPLAIQTLTEVLRQPLPASRNSTVGLSGLRAQPKLPEITGGTILIAFESDYNLTVANKLLSRLSNYQQILVRTGAELLECCEERDFDVILMDVSLPVVSGIKAAQTLRNREKELGKRTPIICTTHYSEQIAELQATGLFDSVLLRPLSGMYLREALDKCAKSPAAQTKHMSLVYQTCSFIWGRPYEYVFVPKSTDLKYYSRGQAKTISLPPEVHDYLMIYGSQTQSSPIDIDGKEAPLIFARSWPVLFEGVTNAVAEENQTLLLRSCIPLMQLLCFFTVSTADKVQELTNNKFWDAEAIGAALADIKKDVEAILPFVNQLRALYGR